MRRFMVLIAAAGLASCDVPTKTEAPAIEMSSSSSSVAQLPAGVPEAPTMACMNGASEFCEQDKKDFEAQWPKAWAGNYQSQRNVAYMQSAQTDGVQHNAVQGCAWRIVILLSGHPEFDSTDTSNFNVECAKLTPAEFAAAKQSAKTIFGKAKGGDLPEVPAPTGELAMP